MIQIEAPAAGSYEWAVQKRADTIAGTERMFENLRPAFGKNLERELLDKMRSELCVVKYADGTFDVEHRGWEDDTSPIDF